MPVDTNVAIAVFTGLTALSASTSLLIGWRLYEHHKVDTGRKEPILLGEGKGLNSLVDHRELSSDWLPAFELNIFNRSAVTQRVRITDIDTLQPTGKELVLFDRSASYDLPPHSGGDVLVFVTRQDILTELVEVRNDVARLRELLEREGRDYLVRVRGETESGHQLSYAGWMRLDVAHAP